MCMKYIKASPSGRCLGFEFQPLWGEAEALQLKPSSGPLFAILLCISLSR